jgi:acetamidase/formamidase
VSIKIVDVSPGPTGWTAVFPRFGLLAADGFGPDLLWWDIQDGVAEARSIGVRIPTAPFLGVVGTCPGEAGPLPVGPPRRTGGNLDTRQLTAGATIHLPVEVDGALLALGDAHARQGDGEVCGTALECAARAVVKVNRGTAATSPAFAPGPEPDGDLGWFATTGIEANLMEASRAAVRRLIEWLVRDYQVSESVAYMLCSVLADLRISEVVDRPNWVVSAFWPRALIERS